MSKLNAHELKQLNQLAVELAEKLAGIEASLIRIAELWGQLHEDDIADVGREVDGIRVSLERVPDEVPRATRSSDAARAHAITRTETLPLRPIPR